MKINCFKGPSLMNPSSKVFLADKCADTKWKGNLESMQVSGYNYSQCYNNWQQSVSCNQHKHFTKAKKKKKRTLNWKWQLSTLQQHHQLNKITWLKMKATSGECEPELETAVCKCESTGEHWTSQKKKQRHHQTLKSTMSWRTMHQSMLETANTASTAHSGDLKTSPAEQQQHCEYLMLPLEASLP